MRILFYLLTFAILTSASGQDYCKNIKKDVSPDKKLFDYSTPVNPDEVTPIKVTRSINIDPDYASDNFLMIFQVPGKLESIYTKDEQGEEVEKSEQKLSIVFDDNTTFNDDTLVVSHDFTPDRLQAIRIIYMPLTEATLKDLSTKKITKFSIAGYEKTMAADDANAIMHYVDCMTKVK